MKSIPLTSTRIEFLKVSKNGIFTLLTMISRTSNFFPDQGQGQRQREWERGYFKKSVTTDESYDVIIESVKEFKE